MPSTARPASPPRPEHSKLSRPRGQTDLVDMTVPRPLSDPVPAGDLGFSYRSRKNGDVQLLHRGKLASTLRGAEAQDFIAEIELVGPDEGQQLMARLTGNYKRGNEGQAMAHPRNRR